MRRLLFVTGTRADFGKLKPLMAATQQMARFSNEIFVTGMHMLQRFGSTWEEVVGSNLGTVHPFLNQSSRDPMDVVLGKTVLGLSDFVAENRPDLIVVHGDRVEALAGAIAGTLSNIRVAHVEGGELSGTVDEALRHAVSKLSHWHFVSNEDARRRLLQLGEPAGTIFPIGSPDIDAMDSPGLPTVEEAFAHYDLNFTDYGILIFHPVTTELDRIESQTRSILRALQRSGKSIVVIESNNDWGSELIRGVYDEFREEKNFRFFPSMRFEFFLAVLKSADFIAGNSSAGVREAPHYGVPAVNIGSRQQNRVISQLVLNCGSTEGEVAAAVSKVSSLDRVPEKNFGHGNSGAGFRKILEDEKLWASPIQKHFQDREVGPFPG